MDEQHFSRASHQYGKSMEISIFLTNAANSPPLRVRVQPYTSSCDSELAVNQNKADSPVEHAPSHGTLQSWVERKIRM